MVNLNADDLQITIKRFFALLAMSGNTVSENNTVPDIAVESQYFLDLVERANEKHIADFFSTLNDADCRTIMEKSFASPNIPENIGWEKTGLTAAQQTIPVANTVQYVAPKIKQGGNRKTNKRREQRKKNNRVKTYRKGFKAKTHK